MNPNTAEQVKEIKMVDRRHGKNTNSLLEAVASALGGKEVLYATSKGNIVIRSVESDTQLITQKQKEAVEKQNNETAVVIERWANVYLSNDKYAELGHFIGDYFEDISIKLHQLENEGKEN